MRSYSFLAVVAMLIATGCSPLTVQTRQVQVQQIPRHPVPAGTTYAVVIPSTSLGAAQLADAIRVPGLTYVATPETADITISASVGQATMSNLAVTSNQVERLVSSGSGGEYTAYAYKGKISVPIALHITSKKYGETEKTDRPATRDFTFDRDPGTNQRFTDMRSLEWSLNQSRPTLLHKAEIENLSEVQELAIRIASDQFTTHEDSVWFHFVTEHKSDPRFAQAITLFDQAVVGANQDVAGLPARMKPAIELWEQIAASPVGDNDEDRAASKGAALYGQAAGLYLSDQLDEAQRDAIAAQSLGVAKAHVESLTYAITDKRRRLAAQGTKP